jgi:flavin reductase (DIM6/NTAB) family NADH-FMN oxidoreductase RutF
MTAPAAGTDPDELPTPDTDDFRKAVGRFATGVTVVTARLDGIDHAMTANAFASVSLDPLLVLVCVEKDARFHDAVEGSEHWAVSILDESARSTATWFASRGRPLHGQIDRYPHHRGPITGAALLDASLATLECRTTAIHDGGDHDIVVGQVLGIGLRRVEHGVDAGPLLWYRARYHTLPRH